MIPGKAEPEKYQSLLDEKIQMLRQDFANFTLPELKVYPSPELHFRMRAEFKIWQKDGVAAYAMYEPGQYKQAILIDEFSIGSKEISLTMHPLMACINEQEILRKKLFQIEFLTSTIGEILVTLIYHKTLEESWVREATRLQEKLQVSIIGRSRGQKTILDKDHIIEKFIVSGQTYTYQQVEASFTQPNARVCEQMLNWAAATSSNIGGDLLELYCGNANFTLPLSKNFTKVLATEISKKSVKSALHNIELNNINNIEIVRLSSEEFTQAINKTRPFQRLSHIDLNSYSFTTIFVDPPRAGLDPGTIALAKRFDNIIYVSCNPQTLKENLQSLIETHEIKDFALFDQFPYTEHSECGVYLTRL